MSKAEFIVWRPDYSVGHTSLDSQHAGLFRLINRYYRAVRAGEAEADPGRVLRDLDDYAESHFADEETIMRRAGFPRLEKHLAAHRRYIERVARLKVRLVVGDSSFALELLRFLRAWWLKHILEMDKEYGPYISGGGGNQARKGLARTESPGTGGPSPRN